MRAFLFTCLLWLTVNAGPAAQQTYYYIIQSNTGYWTSALNKAETACSSNGDTGPACYVGSIDPSKSCTGTCTLNCASCNCCNGDYQCGNCNAVRIVPNSIVLAGGVAFDSSMDRVRFPGKKNSALWPKTAFVLGGGSLQTPAQATFYLVQFHAQSLTAVEINNPNAQTMTLTGFTGDLGAAARTAATATNNNYIVVASPKYVCPQLPTGCGPIQDHCSPSNPPVGVGKLCCKTAFGDSYCGNSLVDGVPAVSTPITTGSGVSQTRTLNVVAYYTKQFGNV